MRCLFTLITHPVTQMHARAHTILEWINVKDELYSFIGSLLWSELNQTCARGGTMK